MNYLDVARVNTQQYKVKGFRIKASVAHILRKYRLPRNTLCWRSIINNKPRDRAHFVRNLDRGDAILDTSRKSTKDWEFVCSRTLKWKIFSRTDYNSDGWK